MGRPRKWKDDAEKAKKYRERKKAALRGVTEGQTALVQRVVAADEKART